MHYTCAACTVRACSEEAPEKLPKNCPMRDTALMDRAFAAYALPENHDFYVTASELEALGYCRWPRLKETIELCLRMGYTRVGLAFCRGLRKDRRGGRPVAPGGAGGGLGHLQDRRNRQDQGGHFPGRKGPSGGV